MSETVDHPEHYSPGTIEVISAIEAWSYAVVSGRMQAYARG